MLTDKRIAFYTLGCKLNFAETSSIATSCSARGFITVSFKSYADVYVINTCTVTSAANKKSRNAIQRALHLNPSAIFVVTGCYAQLKPDEIKDIGDNIIVAGNYEKDIIADLIDQKLNEDQGQYCSNSNKFIPAFSFSERTRSFLKIQDGCDYKCSYCTIPLARGKSRNQSIDDTIKQAKWLVKNNIKEIILTGVNIADFGKTTQESFFDLLVKLESIEGLERIRIGSIEPDLLSDEIILFISQSKHIMPHFHIPLQSGSDAMLKLMRRRYNTDFFADRLRLIKKYSPHSFIGCDVIVGMRGESPELFEKSYDFIKSQNISFIHVFSYSERENTDALKINYRVDSTEIQKRSGLLHQLSEQKHREFCSDNIGKHQSVLWESAKKNGQMYGFTENYIKTEIPFDENYINIITDVELIGISSSGNMTIRMI